MTSNLGIPNELWGPMIIALVSIGGIILTMYFNIKSQRASAKAANQAANAQFTSILNNLSQEHSQLIKDERTLSNIEECELHALAYIDFLERVAFLCLNQKIPAVIADYFKDYFEYVQLMMRWYDEVTVSETNARKSKERWKNIVKWCSGETNGVIIEPDTDKSYLPKSMKEIWEQKIKN